MKFFELHERLRLETWRRIDQGVLSSSLLARQTGLAQAHISNFLHGRRRLSLPALDRVLLAQALTVEELAERHERPSPGHGQRDAMDAVPVVAQSVAMAFPVIPPRSIIDSLQLPSGWLSGFPARRAVSRRAWERFVAVRVTALQALPMDPVLRVGSLAVIDRHYQSLAAWKPPHPNVYAVRSGPQMVFRHVTFESSRLILRPRVLDYPIDVMELASEDSPSDHLVGRICLCVSEL